MKLILALLMSLMTTSLTARAQEAQSINPTYSVGDKVIIDTSTFVSSFFGNQIYWGQILLIGKDQLLVQLYKSDQPIGKKFLVSPKDVAVTSAGTCNTANVCIGDSVILTPLLTGGLYQGSVVGIFPHTNRSIVWYEDFNLQKMKTPSYFETVLKP